MPHRMIDPLTENIIRRVNVGDLLTRSASKQPSRLAIVDRDRRFTYRSVNDWVNSFANALTGLGLRHGDSLAIMSRNRAEFLVTYFACAKIGVVCVPVNLLWRPKELTYVLNHSGVAAIVLEPEFRAHIEAIADRLPKLKHQIVMSDEDAHLSFEKLVAVTPAHEPQHLIEDRDPVSYLYTSGTTSAPKGVASSHLAIYVAALSMALESKLSYGDQVLAMLPLFHTTPLNTLCTPAIAAGATIHIRQGFDAEAVLDLFETEHISVLVALPIMYRALLDLQLRSPRNVSQLRLALYGMAPMPRPELERLIETFNCDFALVFGQTEMSPVTTMFRPEHQLTHSGAAGTPLANVEVGIMDPQGLLLPQGAVGEIVYRGPQVLNGYLHDEAATAEAFRFGWFHSGDAGYINADGLLWFQDRIKDVIKSGGENVASVEVEQALYNAEPRLKEVVVIGLPHERWGEAVTAIAVQKDGEALDERDILLKLRDRLAAHKCPKAIIFTDTLPKTATAKVQKVELRKRFQDYYRGAAS
ncbi:MAG: AMP-binding protein [Hyphomicrobiales bacterium]